MDLLAEERRGSQQLGDRLELVWSGPELAGSRGRDTGVVVREMFRGAKSSVLLSSYALDSKDKSRTLVRPLGDNRTAIRRCGCGCL